MKLVSPFERQKHYCLFNSRKQDVANFVQHRINLRDGFGGFNSLAKFDCDDQIIVGVIYNQFSRDDSGYCDCQMHVAARPNAKWATREFLKLAFQYVFNEVGCHRVTALVLADKSQVLEFNKRLGFVAEGRLREAKNRTDYIVLGMLKSECKWL